MDIKNVNRVESGRHTVIVVPSSEGGIFVTMFGADAVVSREVRLYGISDDDTRTLVDGDTTALEKYVQPDPDEPGTYQLVDCYGSATPTEHSGAGITDNTIREYVPAALALTNVELEPVQG